MSITKWLLIVGVSQAVQIRLSASERNGLGRIARGHKSPVRDKLRAQIVLDAARGLPNTVIARRCGVVEDTVRKWRGRFAAERLEGLKDLPRSGRPPSFTPVQVVEVKALACQIPADADVPLARWSCPELARHVVAAGVVESISTSTLRRWLSRTLSCRSWWGECFDVVDGDFLSAGGACAGDEGEHDL
ncbi:helix-turn-helix domain-containing protein [Actinopolymorpha pittospori]|uniref:helix-turn-helix domain-containing protein n=1 Tax=Actinopolymorpha pittospori TaxID=648752 RepID=UPI00178BBA79|nr:helix-turn-helix domain-containing protein [Actinopolymorpha pittospori]